MKEFHPRIDAKEGQADSGPMIARFRGVERPVAGGPSTDVFNKRLKWDGSQWVYDDGEAEDASVTLYEGNTERELTLDEEVVAVWRSPAKRWDIIGGGDTEVRVVSTSAPISAATVDGSGNCTPGTGTVTLMEWSDANSRYELTVTTATLYNLTGATLAPNASGSARETIPAVLENGRLIWREGTTNTVFKFELTADMAIGDATGSAEIVDSTGALTGSSITVADPKLVYFGYGPYTDVNDDAVYGFQGTALLLSGVYLIIALDSLAEEIEVQLDENIQVTSTTCTFQTAYGTTGARLPKRSAAGGKIEIGDAGGFADQALAGQTWRATYNHDEGDYEFHHEPLRLQRLRVNLYAAVTLSSASFEAYVEEVVRGRAPVDTTGVPIENPDRITVLNDPPIIGQAGDIIEIEYDFNAVIPASRTEATVWRTIGQHYCEIEGTATVVRSDTTFTLSSITVVEGRLPVDATTVLTSVTVKNDPPINSDGTAVVYARFNGKLGSGDVGQSWDTGSARNFLHHLRGLTDWDKTKDQRLMHLATEQPKWQEICDLAVVTDVLINGAGTELQKKTVPMDGTSCTETTTKIADIGECT